MTSYRGRCDVITSHRQSFYVIFTATFGKYGNKLGEQMNKFFCFHQLKDKFDTIRREIVDLIG